jgi:uncharacterized protein YjbI with pentapeptide repeats
MTHIGTPPNPTLADVIRRHGMWLADEPGGAWANLRNADLRGANLSGASLRDADLRDADLINADLRDADLRDADLRDADLSGANLRDAILINADLRDADLRDADLRDANLSRADLSGANLRGANLSGADLSGANLRGANLSGANLHRAKVDGGSWKARCWPWLAGNMYDAEMRTPGRVRIGCTTRTIDQWLGDEGQQIAVREDCLGTLEQQTLVSWLEMLRDVPAESLGWVPDETKKGGES